MKENWTYKKLGEVASYINGFAFKPSDWVNKGLPIIRIQNLNNVEADFNYYDKPIPAKYIVDDGDILISWSASLGVYEWTRGMALLNQHIFKVVFDKSDMDKHYLKYSVSAKLEAMAKLVHGATMQHIVKGDFDNTQIPVPPLSEQHSIVQELDAINEVLSKKREQLKELDKLAQSIFYDMFGDPVTNEKGWEVKKLGEVCSKIGSGATPKGGEQSYISQGISLIRSLNVHNAEFIYKELAHIDEKQARALSNVTIEIDDLLLNITGASVARCCIVPNNILPARVNQHVCILRCKSTINYRFLLYTIISNSYQQYLWRQARSKAATREALPKTIVDNLPIPLPPLPLQQAFAEKIEKIEQMKQNLKASIHETETLLASRMSYWFE